MKKFLFFLFLAIQLLNPKFTSAQCNTEYLCAETSLSYTLTEGDNIQVDCLDAQNTDFILFTTSNNPNNSGDISVSLDNINIPTTSIDTTLQVAVVELNSPEIPPCSPLNWANIIMCTTIMENVTFSIPESGLSNETTYAVIIGNNTIPGDTLPAFDIEVSGTWLDLVACCDQEIIQGEEAIVTGYGSNNGYTWTSDTNYPINNSQTEEVSLSPLETTTLTVTGEITTGNLNTCSLTDEVTIVVVPAIIPFNLFTPNGDGTNDVFEIANIEKYKFSTIRIYDRWGQSLFTSTAGYSKPWDGTKGGRKLPAGTYYYVIELNSLTVDIPPLTGFVTLLY